MRRTLKIAIRVAMAAAILWLLARSAASLSRISRRHRYDGLIAQAAAAHAVDPDLITAVIWRESGFDPGTVGRAGEIGLMQVTPGAAADWARATGAGSHGSAALRDPATNIDAGTWYLARAIRRWDHKADPIPYALAEYNAGRSNALRWATSDGGGDVRKFYAGITYPSTRRYIADIIRRYRGRR